MKKIRWMMITIACFCLAGCGKKPTVQKEEVTTIQETGYAKVTFGSEYNQSEVLLDLKGDRAVVPYKAEWGMPQYREDDEAGIYYGDEDGAEIFDTDMEVTPELYYDTYMSGVNQLGLTEDAIKKANYVVRITKQRQLEPFEDEISLLTGIVMKNKYELTGVELRFDKAFRLKEKDYQITEVDEEALNQGEVDPSSLNQKFSYEVKKKEFEQALKKVKKHCL